MDVNSINNNISNLNNIPQQQAQRVDSSAKVQDKDEFLRISINDYNNKRDELSASLQAFNEGIGISATAKNGLESQKEILTNVKNILKNLQENNSSEINKNEAKNEINQELLNFKEEAFQSKYKNENLLAVDDYEENLSITISTKGSHFAIDKPNTPQIASQIAQTVSKADFNDTDALQATINVVENSTNLLQNLSDQFTDLGNKLESSAITSIQEQIELSNTNRANKGINFGNEVMDFSKSNVNANLGYLAVSQANIVQAQSVRLLS